MVTNEKSQLVDAIHYFPFGEVWLEERPSSLPTDYFFTAKEFDPETGFYNFGARYLDPRFSKWMTADPALGDYMPGAGKTVGYQSPALANAWRGHHDLPGLGGAFRPSNLALYGYGHHNPATLRDPNGKDADVATIGGGITLAALCAGGGCEAAAAGALIVGGVVLLGIVVWKGAEYVLTPSQQQAPRATIADISESDFNIAMSVRYSDIKARSVSIPAVVTATRSGQKVFLVSRSATPQIAAGTVAAFAAGKPGEAGSGTNLTRGPGTEVARRAQRNLALSGARAAGIVAGRGQSLDEYPYASTLEGGTGAWVTPVPVTEQLTQAGLLTAFYTIERVGPGQQFVVIVVP
jgi:RHS repeat-associated protein